MTARWYTVQRLNLEWGQISMLYIKGFGVVFKKLMIHVLENHEKENEQFIKEALKKFPFPGDIKNLSQK